MKKDLIERYIYAATRRLPTKQRADVADELETVISDMLTERCGDVQPEEKDVRVVLTELGTPNELADKYSTDKVKCLIGSPHYMTYKYIVKIVIAAVLFGVTLSLILSHIVEPEGTWFTVIGEWFAVMWSSALQAFAIVTIVFAIICRKGVSVDGSRNLDDLPPVPQKSDQIKKVDCCIGIAFTVIFTALLICVPQIFTGYASLGGDTVTTINLFDLAILKDSSPLLIAIAVISIGSEIVRLVEGRYSKLVAITTAGANAVLIALFSILLSRDGFINRELDPYLTEGGGTFTSETFQTLILAGVILGLVLEAGKAIYKAVRSAN